MLGFRARILRAQVCAFGFSYRVFDQSFGLELEMLELT